MSAQIRDYLQTQGLHLDIDAVKVAQTTAQTVMEYGQAVIENDVWQHTALDQALENIENMETLCKQVFMVLDSAFHHFPLQSAVVYGLHEQSKQLIQIAQFGVPIETQLNVDEETGRSFLASRSAANGWLNLMASSIKWLQHNEIEGKHNLRAMAQMSIPICAENGQVFGVLHLEAAHAEAFGESEQAHWLGLALALLPKLSVLFPKTGESQP